MHTSSSSSSQPTATTKTRFSDKFHAMMQAAQEAHIKAAHQSQLQDRRSLSVAMLVEGRAEAFVDFFMLSQPSGGRPGTASEQGQPGGASTSGGTSELPWQSMVLLQEQLVRADAASRAGDQQAAFDAHRTMAKHFTQLGMLESAVCFWKKCLQVGSRRHFRSRCLAPPCTNTKLDAADRDY